MMLLAPKSYNNRASEIELLRIVSQWSIVCYHILLFWVYPTTGILLFKALQMPSHVGVVIFVLISGYFSIKASSKGLINLLGIFFIYSIPEVICNLQNAENFRQVMYDLFVFSNTHFWFIKSYVYLYLLSPFVNMVLRRISGKQLAYLLAVLWFICQYMPYMHGDDNMLDGTTVTNFVFLYTCGHTIRRYDDRWRAIPFSFLLLTFILLNVGIVWAYMHNSDNTVGRCLWRLAHPYSSPLLLINSVLVFMLFAKRKIHSRCVNWAASSCLAIYLIHGNRPLSYNLIGRVSTTLCASMHSTLAICILVVVLSFFIVVLCVLIDKLLSPVWHYVHCLGDKVYSKIGY